MNVVSPLFVYPNEWNPNEEDGVLTNGLGFQSAMNVFFTPITLLFKIVHLLTYGYIFLLTFCCFECMAHFHFEKYTFISFLNQSNIVCFSIKFKI